MCQHKILPELKDLKKQAANVYDDNFKPGTLSSVGGFFRNAALSLSFILSEKENILFAVLQLISIALGYYIWLNILDWIPQEVWDELSRDDDNDHAVLNLLFLAWSFICVGIVAYPLGIFSACMGASYLLHFQGRKSTIAECLKIAISKSWTLWIFGWIDGWWTMLRILERLPKKKDRTPRSVKIRNEIIYQAWKAASLGFVPAILSGRGIKNSCIDSVKLLKDRFMPILKLRLGYSAICWVFGIGSYLSLFFLMPYMKNLGVHHTSIYNFYFMAFFPALLALLFIMLIFRPLYLISACRIYAYYTRQNNIEIELPKTLPTFVSSFVFFIVLCVVAGVIILFRNELGLTELLSFLH